MKRGALRVAPTPLRLTSAAWAEVFTQAEREFRAPSDEFNAWQRLQVRQAAREVTVAPRRFNRSVLWAAVVAAGFAIIWLSASRLLSSQSVAEAVVPVQARKTASSSVVLQLGAGVSSLPDGSRVTLTDETQARFEVGAERSTLNFELGTADVAVAHQPKGHAFEVRSGKYAFVALGTHFKVVATERHVALEVSEGRVAVERDHERLTVVGANGKWSTEPPANLIPTETVAPNPSPASVSSRPRPETDSVKPQPETVDPSTCREQLKLSGPKAAEQCYLALSKGSGLAAEMALFEAARIQRDVLSAPTSAIATLERFESQFPSGSLLPEVRMAKVDLLARLGRVDEAFVASERVLASAAGRARTIELRLLRGNLLRDRRGDCAAAEAEYRLIEQEPGPRGDQAQFSRAECLERLGRTEEAVADYRRYLQRASPLQANRAQQRLSVLSP